MAYTYTDVVERVRLRSLPLRKTLDGWTTDSVLFTFVVDALRIMTAKTGDYESKATLSIVAGTADYTISTAIAADVGEIHLIARDTSSSNPGLNIEPREIRKWQEENYNQLYVGQTVPWDLTNDQFQTTALFYKVYNGTLSILPTPSAAETVTVYYSPTVANITHSTANMALNVPVNDIYLESLVDRVVSAMYDAVGDPKSSDRFMSLSEAKFQEAKAYTPEYGFDNSVKYHDPVE